MSSKQTKVLKTYQGINEFKKCYQCKTNFIKDENGDLLADSNNILNRCFFCKLSNIHSINVVRDTEIHASETLVPEPSSSEVVIDIEKVKKYKWPGIGEITAALIQAGGNTFCSEIIKLTMSVKNKEKLPQQWKEAIIVPIYEKDARTSCSINGGMSLFPTTYKILSNVLFVNLIRRQNCRGSSVWISS
jgi:hypothetical protein